MTYFDPVAAGRPAPQLTREDMKRMSPEQLVAADDAGQFVVLKGQGRNPLPFEAKGERLATAAEDQAARAAERQAAEDHRNTLRRTLTAQLKEN